MVDFSCHKCNKKFKSQYHLDRHLNRKNSCDKNNIFICDICKKEFTLKFNYERHMKRKIPCVQNSNGESSQSENQIKLEIEKEITKRELEKLKLKASIEIEIEREKSKIRIEEEREKTKEKIKLKQVEEKKTLYIKCENDAYLLVNKIKNNAFFDSINSINELEPPTEEQVLNLISIKNTNEAYCTLLENVYVHNEKNRCVIPIIDNENENLTKLIIKKNNTWYVKDFNHEEINDIKDCEERSYEVTINKIDSDKDIKLLPNFDKITEHKKRLSDKLVLNITKLNNSYYIKHIIENDYLLNLIE